MPFLSAVLINPARPYARSLLNSPHVVHDAVMHGFPSDPAQERILWRWDLRNGRHRPRLLIVNKITKPDWTHLTEKAGWPHSDDGAPLVRDYQPVLDGVTVGRTYEFRLEANPVFNSCQKTPDRQLRNNASERPTKNEAEDRQWIQRRAATNGFEIPLTTPVPTILGLDATPDPNTDVLGEAPAVTATRLEPLRFSRPHNDEGSNNNRHKPVTLYRTLFRGALTVTEPDRFRQALTNGIGRGKAYGLGLLTLSEPSK